VSGHGIRRPGPRRAGPGLSAAIRLVVLVVLVGAGAAVAVMVGLPDLAGLRDYVAALGPSAPAVFVLLYAAATLAPLPKNVMSAVAGLVFGLAAGIGVVLVAAMLGASTAFVLGRALGRDAVERFTGTRVERVDQLLRRRGILAVIGLRLVPVLPFTAINYAAGLTAVRATAWCPRRAPTPRPRWANRCSHVARTSPPRWCSCSPQPTWWWSWASCCGC